MQDSDRVERMPGGEGQVCGGHVIGDVRRMRDAIGVALALLDELMSLMPDKPDRTSLREVEEVFREVREMAAAGLRAVRHTAGRGNNR